jgi:apolipoprotein N-acyltransferase
VTPPGNDRRVRIAIFIAYGVATCFAFPLIIGGEMIDLGLFVGALSPALLVLMLEELPARRAIRWGFTASLAAHYFLFHWFYVVTVQHGNVPAFIGVFAPLVPSLYVSVFTAIFAGGWSLLRSRGMGSPIAAALLWSAIDHFRGFALGGFPWATIGYSQHLNESLMGLAPYTGIYGLSFAVVLFGALLALGAIDLLQGRRPAPSRALALAIVLLLHAPGLSDEKSPNSGGPSIRVAALQGNIAQSRKWNSQHAREILENYLDLSRSAVLQGAEVIVWPESAVPGLIELDPVLRGTISEAVRAGGATHVLGATAGVLDDRGLALERVYDSAFLMDGTGVLRTRYDKSHLVPFGEFVPFRALIGSIFEALALGLASIEVTPGPGPRALQLPERPRSATNSSSDAVKVGVPICYELLFPDLVRRFSRDGARVLFAVTNDAWYGRTGAPYQFLAMTAVRSAENRLWTVRAANSGVSAIIDDHGRVVTETEIFVRDLMVGDVPLSPAAEEGTFYVQNGDVFAWFCWGGTTILFLWPRSRRPGVYRVHENATEEGEDRSE